MSRENREIAERIAGFSLVAFHNNADAVRKQVAADIEAALDAERERAFDQGFILAVAEIMRQHGEDVIARDVMRANPISDWSVIDEYDMQALQPIFDHEKAVAAIRGKD